MSGAADRGAWPRTDSVVTLRPPLDGDAAVLIAGRDDESGGGGGRGDEGPHPPACILVGGGIVGGVDFDTDHGWLGRGEVNRGYNIFPPHRRKGYATRAVRLLLGFLGDHADTR